MAMSATKTTYVVCGQEDGVWELVMDELASSEVAESYLRANFARFPEYTAWYVDRANNDGYAESYWDVRDGSLVHTN